MKLTINKQEINSVQSLNATNEWIEFAKTVTGEHYLLLCYLTTKFNNATILDMGTWTGWSAISLAQNPSNTIITYDIVDELDRWQRGVNVKDKFLSYSNIHRKLVDARKESAEIIKSASLILLDIDPHDGLQETEFTNFLRTIGYKGYVLCDDIHYNQGMKDWWNSVDLPKYDLTDVGHSNAYAGTGLICYGGVEVEIV